MYIDWLDIMPRSRYCRNNPDDVDAMIRPHRDRDASDRAVTIPRPRHGRNGCDHVDVNLRPHADRDRIDRSDTTRRFNHGRGRSGSSSGSDRAPLPRKRSRKHRRSLAPLRGYCKIVELRKAEEEKRIMESKLSEALLVVDKEKHTIESKLSEVLLAEKECLKKITDLNNKNIELKVCNRSLSKDLTRVMHDLTDDQERSVCLTEAHNKDQEKLEEQLFVALQSSATLHEWINELEQRSRNVNLFDHCATRSRSVCYENATGLNDLSEQSSLSTDDDSMVGSVSATLMHRQSTKQPEGDTDVIVGTYGVQEDISTCNQSESLEHRGGDPVAKDDVEEQLSPENIVDVRQDRSSIPSPCGESRAFEVGDELPK